MHNTLTLSIGRNDMEVNIEVEFTADPGRPATYFDPPEDGSMDIEEITILSVVLPSGRKVEPKPYTAARLERIIRATKLEVIEDCCWERTSDRKSDDDSRYDAWKDRQVDCWTAF
jgi:hypothetical protein